MLNILVIRPLEVSKKMFFGILRLNLLLFTATFKRCLELPLFAFLPSIYPAAPLIAVNVVPLTEGFGSNGHVGLLLLNQHISEAVWMFLWRERTRPMMRVFLITLQFFQIIKTIRRIKLGNVFFPNGSGKWFRFKRNDFPLPNSTATSAWFWQVRHNPDGNQCSNSHDDKEFHTGKF